jgi:hypothetical protein
MSYADDCLRIIRLTITIQKVTPGAAKTMLVQKGFSSKTIELFYCGQDGFA